MPGLPAEKVREEFRRNYADASALLERIFGELDLEVGLRRDPVAAPAPEQAETKQQFLLAISQGCIKGTLRKIIGSLNYLDI